MTSVPDSNSSDRNRRPEPIAKLIRRICKRLAVRLAVTERPRTPIGGLGTRGAVGWPGRRLVRGRTFPPRSAANAAKTALPISPSLKITGERDDCV